MASKWQSSDLSPGSPESEPLGTTINRGETPGGADRKELQCFKVRLSSREKRGPFPSGSVLLCLGLGLSPNPQAWVCLKLQSKRTALPGHWDGLRLSACPFSHLNSEGCSACYQEPFSGLILSFLA